MRPDTAPVARTAVGAGPLRVLLAADDSPGSEVARSLVSALRLPPRSTIRVIRALGPEPTGMGLTDAMQADIIGGALNSMRRELLTFATPLEREGVALETDVLRGLPQDAIVRDAARWSAHLIVVGPNRHGAIARVVLGSVAASVVDRSPCPVLVARTTNVRSIILADDGSLDAAKAADVLTTNVFDASVRIVSVVHVARPFMSGVSPAVQAAAEQAYQDELRLKRADHAALAERTATRLRDAGITPAIEVRLGDPGEQILAAAGAAGADLIAMGTRGRTGLERVVLGSVARKILYTSERSVLVARGQKVRGKG